MKAVVTVTGKDMPGIVASVSGFCFDYGGNILDVTQSLLQEYFAMIMLVDVSKLNIPFADFVDKLENMGKDKGLKIDVMHEDIFNSMHRI